MPWKRVKKRIEAVLEEFRPKVVVSGGADGVDALAAAVALDRGVKVRPLCVRPGESPFARNSRIVAEADVVVALWDGKSGGTRDTIGKAVKYARELHVYVYR